MSARIAIDFVATRIFGNYAPEGFLAACPGGRAVEGAPEALDLACRGAVVDATQLVLICFLSCMIWPAWHFFLAARGMKQPRMERERAADA